MVVVYYVAMVECGSGSCILLCGGANYIVVALYILSSG